jgi:hypothetical protein
MKYIHLFYRLTGLALVAATLGAIPSLAQTVISNESLVSTTFVVTKDSVTAKCSGAGCSARKLMLSAIPVTCPAATGQTCTFHLSLDAKTGILLGCKNCAGSGTTGFYQFLLDDAAPTIGPTDEFGNYVFERYAYTDGSSQFESCQGYPTSVLGQVTNTTSNSHTITVFVGCRDTSGLGSCEATTFWTTMRVDIFEP